MNTASNMPRTISATELRTQFGATLDWVIENNREAVITRYGKPSAVLLPYAVYQRLEALQQRDRKRQAVAQLEAIRAQIAEQNPDIDPVEAYREAGFSEEAIEEMLHTDENATRKFIK